MTVHAHPLVSGPSTKRRWFLFLIELIVAVNAVGGAIYGLDGAKGVPREWLAKARLSTATWFRA